MIDWAAMLSGEANQPPAISEAGQIGALPVVNKDTANPVQLPSIVSAERWDDNRRRCSECAKLGQGGRCLAAMRGELVASRTYAPHPDLLRRCETFVPLPSDPDQRAGRDRWPGL